MNTKEPKTALEHFGKGRSLMDLQKYQDAISCYDESIRLNPKHAPSFGNKGFCLWKLGKHEEGIACYEEAIRLNPTDHEVFNNKGNSLQDLGKHEEAISCYDEVIRINPKYDHAFNNKGLSFQALGKYEEAISCYDEAIRINPRNDFAFNNKGLSLRALGKYEEAISCYDEAIKINPKYDFALNNKSLSLKALGKHEEAISCYDEAITINPKSDAVFNNKGNSLQALGRHEEAISCYDEVIRINPRYDFAFNNKGISLEALGKYEEAISCYDETIRINPKSELAFNNKGNSLQALGRNQEAISCYEEAIRINLNSLLPYCNMGKLYQHLENDQMALDCFIKAYEISKHEESSKELAKGNLSYINQTVTEDRGAIIKKLADLQKTTIETTKIAQTLDLYNEKAAKIVEQFKQLKEKKNKLTSGVIDGFQKTSASNDTPAQDALVTEMQNEMKDMQQEITELKRTQETQKAQLNKKTATNKGFNDFEQEDLSLYNYCKTFYWTTINLFGAYRSLSTGLAQGNVKSNASAQEDLLVQGATQLTKYGAGITKGIPFGGGLIGALDKIINEIYTTKLDNRANAINKIIQKKLSIEEDISLSLAQLALAVTQERKELLSCLETKQPAKLDMEQRVQWLKERVEAIKSQIIEKVELNDTSDNSVILALGDVALIMAFLCKSSESVIASKDLLHIQCVNLIKSGRLEQSLATRETSQQQQQHQHQKNHQQPEQQLEQQLQQKLPNITLEVNNATKKSECQSCNMF